MKYFCNNCESITTYLHYKKDSFEHAFGVASIINNHCPICDSENVIEVSNHGWVLNGKVYNDYINVAEEINYCKVNGIKIELEEF